MKPLRLVFALLLALGTPVWAQNYLRCMTSPEYRRTMC